MQHNLRDPESRPWPPGLPDHLRRPAALQPAKIAGTLDRRTSRTARNTGAGVRYGARTELGARDATRSSPPSRPGSTTSTSPAPIALHELTEALVPSIPGSSASICSTGYSRRPNSTPGPPPRRSCCVWRDRVPSSAARRGSRSCADPCPLVGSSGPGRGLLPGRRGQVPLVSADHPTDEYLDYARGETMKTLGLTGEGCPLPASPSPSPATPALGSSSAGCV